MNSIVESITYFPSEGKANLTDCLRLSFETLVTYGLNTLVILTGSGEGVQKAIDDYLSEPNYSHIHVVGVTFAQGFVFSHEGETRVHVFPSERKRMFAEHGIPIVQANLPFNAIATQHQRNAVLAQDLSIIGNALNVFCGSMSLCIQAVLTACDAGEVRLAEHLVVMTSDTALLVRAAPTSQLLTDLIVRQIICKPAFLTISKAEEVQAEPTTDSADPNTLEAAATED